MILTFLWANSLRIVFNLKTRGRYSKDTRLLLKLVKIDLESKNKPRINDNIAQLV